MKRRWSWLTVGLLVLGLHVAFLLWAQSLWQPKSRIQLMAEPIYARLIAPKEPAALPKPRNPQQAPAPAQPQAAVQKHSAVASRPLPEPTAAPTPVPTTVPQPTAAPKVPEPQQAGPVEIPPPPPMEQPLFAALEDDWPEPVPTPSPTPTPTEWPSKPAEPADDGLADVPEAPERPADNPILAVDAGLSPGETVLQAGQDDGYGESNSSSDSKLANGAEDSTGTTDVYQDWPSDTRINLKVSGYFRGKVTGNGQVTWQRQEERYQAQVAMSFGIGGFTMTSQGAVTDEGLNPSIFEEKVMGRIRSARFEPDTITTGSGKRIPRAGLNQGLGTGTFQDSASQFVELAWRFATGRASLAQGQTVTYWLGRPEGLYQYVFDISGPHPMDLPKLGTVNTWHLVPRRIPRLSKDAIYGEIWVAPSLQYLPVKIRMRNDTGMTIDMLVDSIEQADAGRAVQP